MVKLMESRKLGEILLFAITLMALINLNILAGYNFFRIDLTEEKRYTISEASREILNNLNETIYIDVYLEGELPSGFKRLQNTIRETLEEFAVYSDNKIQFQFIDPEQAISNESRNEFILDLASKGIQPTDVFLTENGQRIQKRILPGAIVSYGSREKGVLLLKGNRGAPSEIRLNQSIEGVEYELISAIKSLVNQDFKTIAYDIGHGEPRDKRIDAFRNLVEEKYLFSEIDISADNELINQNIDALVIAKPSERFSIEDKLKIDQYLMNGGNLMLFMDVLDVNMDSVLSGTYSFPLDHDLDDLFFRYGFRINKDLLQDYQSGATPVVVGNFSEDPQIQLLPWPFYPIVNVYNSHPIVRNLDAIQLKFASSIDTVKADGVVKTPLMFSSPYSKTTMAPVRVFVDDLKAPRQPSDYQERNIPVGYLLSGKFTSMFKNRLLPDGFETLELKEEGQGKIFVISDGDIIINDINPRTGQPQVLGFDLNTQQSFAHADLISNALEYLTNADGLILARNKEIIIRPLDRARVNSERQFWQMLNLTLPVIVVIVFGLIKLTLRKRKYTRFK